MADTEKKIYGVDTQIKDALIRSLRNAKVAFPGSVLANLASSASHYFQTLLQFVKERWRNEQAVQLIKYKKEYRNFNWHYLRIS